MTDKQPEALRLADRLEGHSTMETRDNAANLLRAQLVAIERKDALLRQCLKHVASNISMTSDGTEAEELYEAIKEELQ